jgi:hypothetical protein
MKDIKVLKAKPLFTGIITTCNQWEMDGETEGLIDTDKSSGVVKPHQTVVSVGTSARNVKEGDVVIIDPTRFMEKKYRDGSLKDGVVKENEFVGFKFPIIDINGTPHLLLREDDISYIVEEYEEYDIPMSNDLLN